MSQLPSHFLLGTSRALRGLRRAPGFAILSAAILALGLGSSAALVTLVDGILVRELPYPRAAEIVRVSELAASGRRQNVSQPNFEDLREQSSTFSALARVASGQVSITGVREPQRLRGATVSSEFFSVFGVAPERGRLFAAEELVQSGPAAVVVSASVWRDVLGAPQDLSNARLTFDETVYSVVGVLPEGFAAPEGSRVWVAAERFAASRSRTALNWQAFGRVRPGVSVAAARADLSRIAKRQFAELGDQTWMTDADAVPLRESIVGRSRTALWLLLAASGFLLLVATFNVANLFLARATSRRREVAIRLALGAQRGALFPEFLGETLAIGLAGAVAGLGLATLLIRVLRDGAPNALPRLSEVGVGWPTVLATLSLAIAVAVALAGALTAWSRRASATEALGGGRSETESRGRRRVQRVLAASQVALAMTLLGVAGLLGRSVQELLRVDSGYAVERRTLIEIEPPSLWGGTSEAERAVAHAARRRLIDDLLADFSALPGAEAVGVSNTAPLTGAPANGNFLLAVAGESLDDFDDLQRVSRLPGRVGQASYVAADAGYFQALEIPLRSGRGFEPRDLPDAPHVALLSESLAATNFPGQDPIGRQIQFGNMDGDLRLLTVVGVVGDTRHRSLADSPTPIVYVNLRQRPAGARSLHFVIVEEGARTGVSPDLGRAAEQAARRVAPDLPPVVRSYETVVAGSMLDRALLLRLVGGFALAALLLSTAAAAGVAAFGVARRKRELGVRLAIGAEPSGLLKLVLGEELRSLLISLAIGLGAAWAAGRALRAQLFGIEPGDPLALAGAALALAVAVLLATAIPASRAARTDPVAALRGDGA